MRRIPLTTGDEHDVLGRRNGRKHYNTWARPGKTDAVKRGYRRRERRLGKADIARQLTH